ncbi:hypothetical protein BDD43_1738 [Mucilaginibacter gracilis]|uniref:Uncharacterized protein n=1 Tax=Mucilaginibacter gracilis TaxID=423350 RepID=A0A495J0G7_9SPHI|nr:hypothetical protein [Mucilaginibacter gracilis]RKR81589.1 hypothetical protein BDD43_1738 [Mucilaginibacter gracilis]
MDPEFLTFRRFNEPALAKRLTALLDEKGFAYEVEDNSLVFNPSFVANDELAKEYCIKLRKQDFDTVNELLVAEEEQNIDNVEPDYYLFAFADNELRDIIINQDEWSAFDFALARKILNDRGIAINAPEIELIRQQRLTVLRKPEKTETLWIVIGYMCVLLGGVLGICIGWILWKFKKTLPNGERVYSYTATDRAHGKWIFILGWVTFVLGFIARLYH